MTLDKEINLDLDQKVFTDELFSEYRKRHSEALDRQSGLIKAVIWSDAALALFISGRNIKVPTLDIGLSDLPVAREVLAIAASLTFMFLCAAFVNSQLYEAILQTLSKKKALGSGIDPEFISSGYMFSELHVKTNRAKMNISGVDFFEPGIGYRIYYGAITLLMMLSFIGIVLLHFGLIFNATWPDQPFTTVTLVIFVAATAMNFAGFALALSPGFHSTAAQFEPVPAPPSQENPTDNA